MKMKNIAVVLIDLLCLDFGITSMHILISFLSTAQLGLPFVNLFTFLDMKLAYKFNIFKNETSILLSNGP